MTAPGMRSICADLEAEHRALDVLVDGLDDQAWDTPTPAEGWMVRDQISHLGFFDRAATLAATDPDAFQDHVRTLRPGADTEDGRSRGGGDLLAWWRTGRSALMDVLAALDPAARVPWYGPAMGAVSFATARLMETWAHGQDVADALGAERPATDRLRHVCHIGVRARPFSYANRGLTPPADDVRVELVSPAGEPWTWGDQDAANAVRGPALDFALVVTQRRHLDDADLTTEGAVAAEWMGIAQAFAGPPGPGRPPRRAR